MDTNLNRGPIASRLIIPYADHLTSLPAFERRFWSLPKKGLDPRRITQWVGSCCSGVDEASWLKASLPTPNRVLPPPQGQRSPQRVAPYLT
jgi:hypothetical protein